MRKLFKILFSRNALIVILLLVQVTFLVTAVALLSEHFFAVYLFIMALNLALVIYLNNTSENPSYKLPWAVAIMVFPLFAGLAYVLIKTDIGNRMLKKNYAVKFEETKKYLVQDPYVAQQLRETDTTHGNLASYLASYSASPVYRNRETRYFHDGGVMYEAMKEEIRNAKRYIFMEYFIISDGEMWQEILELLKERAQNGVDVRIFYDGFGTQLLMPHNYFDKLKKFGIQCKVFNGFKPFLTTSQNNRDHRKILVIDGHTAFTGGVNLADEYINRKERFGHWKDGGMMCRGEAAWSFAFMFLQLWELDHPSEETVSMYRPTAPLPGNYDGYIQPYSDSPTDEEYVGKYVYLDIINNAQRYVYIMTPYLIPDDEILTAMELACKKGVDIRIITPHIPDKWYTYSIAWSYYRQLLEMGIKIYEYTPGFIHAKNFISDDDIAVVGTINLDYRSLYLHFECAAVMYGCSEIGRIREDFTETFEKCMEITLEDCAKRPLFKRLITWILRVFAPLL